MSRMSIAAYFITLIIIYSQNAAYLLPVWNQVSRLKLCDVFSLTFIARARKNAESSSLSVQQTYLVPGFRISGVGTSAFSASTESKYAFSLSNAHLFICSQFARLTLLL